VDFPGLDDLNRSLSEIRERMQRQIEETREVRALRTVEKIMPDLTEVLAFLTERTEENTAGEQLGSAEAEASAADIVFAVATDHRELEVAVAEVVEPEQGDAVEARLAAATTAQGPVAAATAEAEAASHFGEPPAKHEASVPPGSQSDAGGPSLAYSLAQMMVQAMVPPTSQSSPPPGAQDEVAETKEANDTSSAADHSAEPSAERAA
jgi:hypothetical protein